MKNGHPKQSKERHKKPSQGEHQFTCLAHTHLTTFFIFHFSFLFIAGLFSFFIFILNFIFFLFQGPFIFSTLFPFFFSLFTFFFLHFPFLVSFAFMSGHPHV
ncbi:hypothetical protein Dimus_037844 [Dionaea muscipula]